MINFLTLNQKQFLKKQTLTLDKANGILHLEARVRRKSISGSVALTNLDPDYVDVRMIPSRFLFGMVLELVVALAAFTLTTLFNIDGTLHLGFLALGLFVMMLLMLPTTRIRELHFYSKDTMRPVIAIWYKGKAVANDSKQFVEELLDAIKEASTIKKESAESENKYDDAALMVKDLYLFGVISYTELTLLRQSIQKKAKAALHKKGVIKQGNLIDISEMLKGRDRVN